MPPQPDEPADEHRYRADLRKCQHEHPRRQRRRERYAGDRQPDAAQHRLNERRDHDAERDTPSRHPGEAHDVVAALSCEASAEPAHPAGGIFTGHVKDCADDDREQELHAHQTEVANLGDEPARGADRVRFDDLRELFQSFVCVLAPKVGRLLADDRDLVDELGWRRKFHIGETIRPADDLAGVGDDRADRSGKRCDEYQQQRRRHDGRGEPTLAPEARLEPAQDRPCGHDDHRRPDGCREERPQDPDRGGDESADDEDRENGTGEIAPEVLFHGRASSDTGT